LRAEIRVPGLAARSCCLREDLTVPVGTGEAAEVPALPEPALVMKNVISLCWAYVMVAPSSPSRISDPRIHRLTLFMSILPWRLALVRNTG